MNFKNIYEHIVNKNGKWLIYSKDYKKKLGSFDSKEKATKRLKQIEYFKHLNEDLGSRFDDKVLSLKKNSDGDYIVNFYVGKEKYRISICKLDRQDVVPLTNRGIFPKKIYEIVFGIMDNFDSMNVDLQNNKSISDARKVLDTVIKTLSLFIEKENPDCIKFSGAKEEGSRVRKYDKFAKDFLSKKFGFKLLSGSKKDDPMKEYYLYK